MINNQISHFSKLLDIDFNLFDIGLKGFSDFEKTFCNRCPKKCDYNNTHLYGCYESARWDNKYIYYCPKDFIFIATPIVDEYNILTGGVIAGPIIMGEVEDFEETYGITGMDTSRVNHLAEIMSAVFSSHIPAPAPKLTAEFLNTVYSELEIADESYDYPIELERQLQNAILTGDEKSARKYLNKFLGNIFFRSNGDFSVIKTRALELLVLLSRSAIDGGAQPEAIFSLNNDYIKEIDRFENLEQLSLWLSSIINRFVGYVFAFGDIKHADTLHKIVAFIKQNYMNKITLDDVAEHVYMSRTYISKIFNEEMNMSFSAYINKLRIDKSKQLLAKSLMPISEVAVFVGFEDQSYFTKQFKAVTGLSPKKFRENLNIANI